MLISDFELTQEVFIIAELSANHNHSLELAKRTIAAAKRAGANAIKLQTYKPETITLDVQTKDFKIKQGTIWDGKYLFDLYAEAYTPWEWHEELFNTAKNEGLICFSSPFDPTAVDLLEQFNVPAYKIASFEITDVPLIEFVASKGKPVIISTGIADDKDIQLALDTCYKQGNDQIILLKCTSSYPAPIEDANLSMIPDMAKKFNVLTGLSDHTLGITVPIVATTLGAQVIEKHFRLDDHVKGVDASFSLTEMEFATMVKAVREAERSIGTVDYQLTAKQLNSRSFSRSLYVAELIKKGEKITQNNIRSVRPGYGLHPKYYYEIMGKIVNQDLIPGTAMSLKFLD